MTARIGLKMSLGFGAALLILSLIGVVSYYSTRQFMGTVNWVTHTYRILDSLEQVLSHAKDIDIGVCGYLLTGEERYLEPHRTALAGIDQSLQDLLDLTMHHPQRHLQITSFRDMIATRKALANELVDLWRVEVGKGATSLMIEQLALTKALSTLGGEPDDVARLLSLRRTGKQVMDEMRIQVHQIKQAENALLQQHRGAAFFTLPVLKDELAPAGAQAHSPTVLVCDDDPAVADILHALLGRRGYRVVTVTSSQEAVDQAILQESSLILLDLIMPGMSGWETMATLKARRETKAIPIVILSALSEQKGSTLTMDFAGWVHKPFDDASLFQTLEHAMKASVKMTRVLVVEDDLDLAKVLVGMFARHGIQAAHAQTGLEAIRLSQRLLPDLLVLDIVLPKADGFAVVDWLRHYDRLQEISLVVHSAKDLDNAERDRLKLGYTQFMTKGRVTPEEFETQVIGLLNRMVARA